VKEYFRDFLLGLDYIHNFANVVHRDINPGNLLISDDGHLKIAYFGQRELFRSSSYKERDCWKNKLGGSNAFLAPEA